jgi:hypothetical protein
MARVRPSGWVGRMAGMDNAILWRVAVVQFLAVLVLSLVLGVLFSHGFFDSWGWLVGPLAWMSCAWLTAAVVGLPVAPVLLRAAGAGIVSALFVLVGLHWLGALVAIGLFAALCARLPRPLAGDLG